MPGNKSIPKEKPQRFVDLIKQNTAHKVIINDEADRILSDLNSHIISEGLDRVELKNEGFEFEFTGEVKLKNGWLQCLATLKRENDVTIEPSGSFFGSPLDLLIYCLRYDYTAQFMGINQTGGIDGSVRDAKFTIIVGVDTETCEAQLEGFKLNRQG
ncbi:hypothetical protein ILUMI_17551, partial [Ignelater luminosus]